MFIVFEKEFILVNVLYCPFSNTKAFVSSLRIPERHDVFREAVKDDASLQVYFASLPKYSVLWLKLGFLSEVWDSALNLFSGQQLTLRKSSYPLYAYASALEGGTKVYSSSVAFIINKQTKKHPLLTVFNTAFSQ